MSDIDRNLLRGHAEDSDGILEYDNKLPAWWVWLFIGTVVWGAVVWVDWHMMNSKSLASLYDAEMAAAPAPFDVNTIEVVMSPEAIAAGSQLWTTHCAACHLEDASGKIGPNLTDAEWIHGGTPNDIRNVVANGVLEKGMPKWLPILGPDGVAQVSAYVASLTAPAAQ